MGVTLEQVRLLLGTFISGKENGVIEPLRQLMTTVINEKKDAQIQWVPFHMMNVLEEFADRVLPQLLGVIPRLFSLFTESKVQSGDSWECLFIIVVLIRCLSGKCDDVVLPLPSESEDCTVSYNELFDRNVDFATADLNAFVGAIRMPQTFPHAAIFYPSHAGFPLYDVIVAYFDMNRVRTLYGYQLKEGKALPKKGALPVFEGSFVIRGAPARQPGTGKDWTLPSADQIKEFFGVSGRHWTPQEWAKLCH
jgi:hypothetical protein